MHLRIAEPCEERWEDMERRPEGRFCDRCQHTVLDLTRLTKREATKRLKQETRDYVCVQLAMRGDDAVFKPEPKSRWAPGLVLAAALTVGCSGGRPAETETPIATAPTIPTPIAPEPIAPTPVATEVIIPVSDGPVEPTAEQRELTRRKHAPPVPPQTHMVLGRMPLNHF